MTTNEIIAFVSIVAIVLAVLWDMHNGGKDEP